METTGHRRRITLVALPALVLRGIVSETLWWVFDDFMVAMGVGGHSVASSPGPCQRNEDGGRLRSALDNDTDAQ